MPKITSRVQRSASEDIKKIELAIQVSKLYYEENCKKQEIVRQLGIPDTRAVNQLLNFAEAQGIIKISIGGQSGIYLQSQRNSLLETELVKTYQQLERAIVVNIPQYEQDYAIAQDKKIHECIGRALAEDLHGVLRSGDHIGVTGGRATLACALAMDVLKKRYPFAQQNITVTSLAGGITRNPEIHLANLMSADIIASRMASVFREAKYHLLSIPWIAFREFSNIIKYPSEEFISSTHWKENPHFTPNIGIFGIGIWKETSHPFYYEEKPELQPVKQLLLNLKQITSQLGYDAIGDFAQRFFVVDPPDNHQVDTSVLEDIRKIIDEINAHAVAVTETQIKEISCVIAVGGGKYKQQAIWTLLSKPDIWNIQRLCTDSETAQWLIDRRMKLLNLNHRKGS